MRAFHTDQIVVPLPAGHRFPAAKQRALRETIEAQVPEVRLAPAPLASVGELALAHDPGWIAAVLAGTTTAQQQREIGFPWSTHLVERSQRSVGATIAAARCALFGGEGIALNLAGGTHHAYADRGSGYCVFNDVAVAARLMQAEAHRGGRGLLQVTVIDLDVHQGNGTAAIFRDDDTVFTLSLHGEHNFPFRKETSDLDVALPDGCDDARYLAALEQALEEAWHRQRSRPPGLVFYLAGADPHHDDSLGRLAVSEDGLLERDRRVFEALAARGIPVAVSMAGGYGRDPATTVRIHHQTVCEALVSWRRWRAARPNAEESMEQSPR